MKKISGRVLKDHVCIASRGTHTKVKYFAPRHENDLKRIGKKLTISKGKHSITLDGKGIRSLEKVLDEVYYQTC